MTEREIVHLLIAHGWTIKTGRKHNQARHPHRPGVKISIPRHKGDIPKGTLNNILKAAGLKGESI